MNPFAFQLHYLGYKAKKRVEKLAFPPAASNLTQLKHVNPKS